MLCGITIRFQMLFLSERQVTHALLTRPPLFRYSVGRSLRHNFIVRLACVKHAASVRPEPGSNSPQNMKTKFQGREKPENLANKHKQTTNVVHLAVNQKMVQ